MKVCKICENEKQDSEFNAHPKTKDRLDSRCKNCKREKYLSEKDLVCKRQAERRKRDPEGLKARQRISQAKYLEKNREICYQRIKDWAQENPDAAKSKTRNYVARKRNAEGIHSSKDIADILQLQNGKCKVCEVDVSAGYHVDHLIALVNGGTNWPSNLQILCPSCNTSKGAKDFDEWLNSREKNG